MAGHTGVGLGEICLLRMEYGVLSIQLGREGMTSMAPCREFSTMSTQPALFAYIL
jgi:hypothetical protein